MNMQTVVGLAGLAVSFALMCPMLLAKPRVALCESRVAATTVRGNDRWPTGRLDLRVVLVFGVDSVSCNWGGLHPAARCGLRAQSREIPARSDSRETRDWPARLCSRLCVTQRHLSLTRCQCRRGLSRGADVVARSAGSALGRPPRHDAGRRRIWRQGSRPGHSSAA